MLSNNIKEILITEEEIIEKCKELGEIITEDYKDKDLILVGLLKGSVPFLAELTKYICLPIEIDYMDVSSYEGTESTGEINILKDLDCSVKDRDVIIVEDIVDTGRTLLTVKEHLKNKKVRSVKVVSLLDKKSRRVVDINPDYLGFDIPDKFVIGFGLDFNQKYRNLPYVGVLKDEFYS